MTTSLFDSLPGIEIPVSEISQTLAHIWETPDDAEYVSPSEFRATQMNLIVHFGQKTSPAEANQVFATALRFSQRYPSRLLLLCPGSSTREEILLSAKLFSECYIGKSGRDRSCCESIALSYPPEGKSFLENQVSILLETDLPAYYWIHQFQSVEKVADYSFFLNIAKRVVLDSGCETEDVSTVAWPQPKVVRDLAFARLLPIRQSIGQFLSRFSPGEIARGLTRVEAVADSNVAAEAGCLLQWMRGRLEACAGGADLDAEFTRKRSEKEKSGISLRLAYSDDRYFRWEGLPESSTAEIEANYGSGRIHLSTSMRFLPPESALAEALFF